MSFINQWSPSQRWRPFVNESTEVMPPFACGALPQSAEGAIETSMIRVIDGVRCLRVRKPDALAVRQQSPAFLVFNGPLPVLPGKRGVCTQDMPAIALRIPMLTGATVMLGVDNGVDAVNSLGSNSFDHWTWAGPVAGEWYLGRGQSFTFTGRPTSSRELMQIDSYRFPFRPFHSAVYGECEQPADSKLLGAGTDIDSAIPVTLSKGLSDVPTLLEIGGDHYGTCESLFQIDSGDPFNGDNGSNLAGSDYGPEIIGHDGLYFIDVGISAATFVEDDETVFDTDFSFALRVTAYDAAGVATEFNTHLAATGAEDYAYGGDEDTPAASRSVFGAYSFSGWLPLKAGWLLHVLNYHTRSVRAVSRINLLKIGDLPELCDVPWQAQLYGG